MDFQALAGHATSQHEQEGLMKSLCKGFGFVDDVNRREPFERAQAKKARMEEIGCFTKVYFQVAAAEGGRSGVCIYRIFLLVPKWSENGLKNDPKMV